MTIEFIEHSSEEQPTISRVFTAYVTYIYAQSYMYVMYANP